MSHETNLGMLDYIDKSGQAMAVAQVLATKVAEEEEKAAALIPDRVQALLEGGHIQETEKQAAHDKMGTHEGALQVIGNLIQINAEMKQAYEQKLAAAGSGQAVPPSGNGHRKVAEAQPGMTNDDLSAGGFIGGRGGGLRQSDLSLMKVANIQRGGRRVDES